MEGNIYVSKDDQEPAMKINVNIINARAAGTKLWAPYW